MTRKETFIFAVAISISILLGVLASSTAFARPKIELETTLSGQITVPYGAGVGYAFGAPGFGTLVGLGLGQRAVILTGLGFSAGEYENDNVSSAYLSLSVPLFLKLYLRQLGAGKVVPTVRVGGAYSFLTGCFSSSSDCGDQAWAAHRVQASAAFGLMYFFNANLALGLEAGLSYGRSFQEESSIYTVGEGWSLGADWRAGLLLRI